jgi:hypothetical protein
VRFVEDEDGGAAALFGFGGEGVGGLGQQGSGVNRGVWPQAMTICWQMPRMPIPAGLGR